MPQSKRPRAGTATDSKTGPLAGQTIGPEAEVAHGEIVHVPRDTPASIYEAMDALDEQQIVAEILGQYDSLVDALVYEFPAGKDEQGRAKMVRGLSYTGVNWCVREMAKRGLGRIGIARNEVTGQPLITLSETADPDGEPIYEAVVVAVDSALGTEAAGMADAKLYPPKKGGGVYTDPHAKRKAVSKAQRNAKAALVPEELKAELMARVKGAQIKRVQTPRQKAEQSAAARQQQRANGVTAQRPTEDNTPATAGQQKKLMATAREHGLDPASPQFKAVLGWVSGVNGIDRFPKRCVDEAIAALADWEGQLSLIYATATDEQVSEYLRNRAQGIIRLILEPNKGEANDDDAAQAAIADAQARMTV